jgi:hypothetical protein
VRVPVHHAARAGGTSAALKGRDADTQPPVNGSHPLSKGALGSSVDRAPATGRRAGVRLPPWGRKTGLRPPTAVDVPGRDETPPPWYTRAGRGGGHLCEIDCGSGRQGERHGPGFIDQPRAHGGGSGVCSALASEAVIVLSTAPAISCNVNLHERPGVSPGRLWYL